MSGRGVSGRGVGGRGVGGREATVAAVDLGASNGRVMVGRAGPDGVRLVEAARFPNVPVQVGGTLHTDMLRLYRGVLDGLREAVRLAGRSAGGLDSIGVDSWAVDYGLLDADGALLGNPVHYRDARTEGVMDRVLRVVPAEEVYRATGIQFLSFNTVYQLVAAAERGGAQLAVARRLLLLPDLVTNWLTGSVGAELTNASTTQLLDVAGSRWHTGLMRRLGIRPDLFPGLRRPGEPAGELLPGVQEAVGATAPVPVTAVASHDTASAVVAVPAVSERFGYVSAGTWSLAGVELDRPVLTEESRLANFTNEVGVDGTVRYLRNVMGLWLLQECLRHWAGGNGDPARGEGRAGGSGGRAGHPGGRVGAADLERLLAAAARAPAFRAVVDADAAEFLAPGDMPSRIAAACRRLGQPVPAGPAETVRCVLDSLALAHRAAVADVQRLSGRDIDVVHIVGGGARNELLCQLTADACGLPVEAGPFEATAVGNVLVQARALGAVGDDLTALRATVRASTPTRRYLPRGDRRSWELAAARLGR
ncbi:MAG: rhamnulokinase [Actinomycetales bacterium]|nr:rhamnulokinase [Actinomycetales bacterium]